MKTALREKVRSLKAVTPVRGGGFLFFFRHNHLPAARSFFRIILQNLACPSSARGLCLQSGRQNAVPPITSVIFSWEGGHACPPQARAARSRLGHGLPSQRNLTTFLCYLLAAALSAQAATYYVSPSGNDANSGASLGLAKQTIQAAINISSSGDTVLVADGTYAPITINQGITVRSVNGAQTTTIDGGGVMRCVHMSMNAVLDGFTVKNGYAPDYGGGVYAIGGTVEHCTILGNKSYAGGGVYVDKGTVWNCTISENATGFWGIPNVWWLENGFGGGVFVNEGTIQNCTISSNTGAGGAGVYAVDADLQNCAITRNVGPFSWTIFYSVLSSGGGIYASDSTVNNCVINENVATYGGGVLMANCILQNSTVSQNFSDLYGGGLYANGGTVRNCMVSGNFTASAYFMYGVGGGICLWGGTVENCAITGNYAYCEAGGVYLGSGTVVRNCIVSWNRSSRGAGGIEVGGGTVENCTITGNRGYFYSCGVFVWSGTVRNCIAYYNHHGDVDNYGGGAISYSCIGTYIAGIGNITNAPLFVSTGTSYGASLVAGNYRLQPSSPCINAGINQTWMTSAVDLDGLARISDGLVDMGAYEFNTDPGIFQFSPSSYQVNEDAGTITLTVTRTRGSYGPASVDYTTADGTASAGSDYTAQSGTLSWADGDSSSKTITISISDDLLIENAETFTATLSNAQGASLGPASLATVTITDNESGEVQFSIPSYEVNEDAGTVTLVVTRTGGSFGPASVDYVTANGTASAGSDYTAQSGTLSWANGDASSKTITVAITDDSLDESDETFTVTLSNAQGASLGPANVGTVTILDNDEPSRSIVQFAVTYVEVNEDGGSATLAVIRTGGSFGPASVDFVTADGTASAGSDYTLQSGTLSWADGDAASKTITVAIIDDSLDENDETLTVRLNNVQGAGLGPANLATVVILDNDTPPREYLVDLEVSGFKLVPVNLWAGDNPAEIEFDLLNEGPGDLDTVGTQLEISFYLSVNMTLGDEDDIAIGTKIEVLELAAGSQTTVRYPGRAHNTDITIPEGLSGDYYVFLSIHLASSMGLYDLDGASAMREGPIRVRIHPTGGGGGSGGGGNSQQQRIVANDYDGDGQDDLTSYDEASGDWAVQLSRSAQLVEFVFGGPGYESVAADYDGDSLADPAIHQRNGPAWTIMLSGQGYAAVHFNLGGAGGTQGAVGDYLGAGQANPGLYEEQSGRWYVLTSPVGAENAAIASAVFGGPGWTSVVGDYDGDGRADPALYEEATGNWLIMLSALEYGVVSADLGGPGSRPVPGDYDGDGKTDLAIMDASGGWYYRLSSRGYTTSGPDNFGQTGQPAPGDYDGDGKSDPAVVSATGWYFWLSGSSYTLSGPYALNGR